MASDVMEVRPNARKNGIVLAVVCAALTLLGFWMLLSGEEVIGGLLAIVFCGGIGIFVVPKILRRQVSLVLTAQGIEQRYVEGVASIPWSDIEAVGVVSMDANNMVGIRLKSYDYYLGNMSPLLIDKMMKGLRFIKPVIRIAALLRSVAPTNLWHEFEKENAAESLKQLGKIGDLAGVLLWSRAEYGYDILLSWVDIDRSAAAFVELLEQYLLSSKQDDTFYFPD